MNGFNMMAWEGVKIGKIQLARAPYHAADFELPRIGIDPWHAEMTQYDSVPCRGLVFGQLMRKQRDAPEIAGRLEFRTVHGVALTSQ
jgi:hypothetical protein